MSTDSTIKATAKEKIKGWIKMAIGTAGGLLSGAIVMYVTPLVDKVVRPSKPLANFSHEKDGLKIRFQNLSSGGQGWWEFGDGTPLEPVSPEREFVNHVYTRPGEYTVKMTLRNVLGEENERQVVLHLDPPPTLEPTKVLNLEAIPVSAGSYAPATFKIMSTVKNAQLCVWDLGDDRPLEVTNAKAQERMVTFQKPGGYVIKLAAVNGLEHDQKTEIVNVLEPPEGTVTALLTISDSGINVEKTNRNGTFSTTFLPEHSDPVFPFERQLAARPNFTFGDVRFQTPSGEILRLGQKTQMVLDPGVFKLQSVRNLLLTISADRKILRLTGELVRSDEASLGKAPLPTMTLPVELVEERRTPATRSGVPVATTLAIPSNGQASVASLVLPSLPQDWVEVQRKIRLELRDETTTLWQETKIPSNGLLTFQTKRFLISATKSAEQIRIDLVENQPETKPTPNN